MCGRFTYRLTWPELVRLYRLTLDAPARNPQPRYNICPTTDVDVVIERNGRRELLPMRWGLVPSWWPKPLKKLKAATFNARAETIADKPIFREAFKHSRCLIPASGYYEWHDTPDGKQPYYFTRRDGEPITIAGLWDTWRDKQAGETIRSCAMSLLLPSISRKRPAAPDFKKQPERARCWAHIARQAWARVSMRILRPLNGSRDAARAFCCSFDSLRGASFSSSLRRARLASAAAAFAASPAALAADIFSPASSLYRSNSSFVLAFSSRVKITTDVVVKKTAIAIKPAAPNDKSINCSQECKSRPNTRLTFLEKAVFSMLAVSAVGILAIMIWVAVEFRRRSDANIPR